MTATSKACLPHAPAVAGRFFRVLAGVLSALLAAGIHPALAACAVTVLDAYAIEMAPGQPAGAGFMTLVNRGGETCRLVAAQTGRARAVAFHETVQDGPMVRMRPLAEVAVSPGERVTFAPGGRHLMFRGVGKPFHRGETIDVILILHSASGEMRQQSVVFEVRSLVD